MKTELSLLLLAALAFTGCKKDKPEQSGPEENPLSLYLQNSGFDQKTTNFINAGDYEFGFKFTPKVKGKITAITFKIPDNAENTRVTIWNAETKTVLRTVVIPSVSKDVEVRQDIDPMTVLPSETYLLTYNGNDWYKRHRIDNTNATPPINAGSIFIMGYHWQGGKAQNFPVNISYDYYGGDLSFVFRNDN